MTINNIKPISKIPVLRKTTPTSTRRVTSTKQIPVKQTPSKPTRTKAVLIPNSSRAKQVVTKPTTKGISKPTSITKIKTTVSNASAPVVKKDNRPKWDVKGRLEDLNIKFNRLKSENEQLLMDYKIAVDNKLNMEEQLAKMKAGLEATNLINKHTKQTIANNEERICVLLKDIKEKDIGLEMLKQTIEHGNKKSESLKEELDRKNLKIEEMKATIKERETMIIDIGNERNNQINEIKSVHAIDMHNLMHEKNRLESQLNVTELNNQMMNEMNVKQKECIEQMEQVIRSNEQQIDKLKTEYKITRIELQGKTETLENKNQIIDNLTSRIKDLEDLVASLENKIYKQDNVRKRLHNTIQELKGNIRVFCRVRPLLKDETDLNNLEYPDIEEEQREIRLCMETVITKF